MFQLVGAPLVENCLAGFNSSVFAYGQVASQSVLLVPTFSFILHKMMFPDSGVKVIVRIRPLKRDDEEEGETIVQKMSNNSFIHSCFPQLDMFQLVGAPLVENCLAGFNSSVFAYGQEQIKHTDKQLKYQCRCSFLEIYNEQITDLLDPGQRNLQIREDMQTGVILNAPFGTHLAL
ncbi:hypothetical protein NC651_036059 [Populus alba x Populus x berolinensis]|nr:hypothetical protein NC651_036059 [Populus alba x Populus x berolinensis]